MTIVGVPVFSGDLARSRLVNKMLALANVIGVGRLLVTVSTA